MRRSEDVQDVLFTFSLGPVSKWFKPGVIRFLANRLSFVSWNKQMIMRRKLKYHQEVIKEIMPAVD